MAVDSRLLQRWTHERDLRLRQHRLMELGFDEDYAADPFGEAIGSSALAAAPIEERPRRVLYLVSDDR
jgi:hypothetical protein